MQGIRESAGWGPASWWPRSNFVEFKDTNRSPSFSGNWRRCFPLGRRLSNGERHRRGGYARAATFHGVSGAPLGLGETMLKMAQTTQISEHRLRLLGNVQAILRAVEHFEGRI